MPDDLKYPIKVKILLSQLDGYKIGVVEIKTLRNVTTMEGDYADFFTQSKINTESSDKDIAENKNLFYLDKGKRPYIKFKIKDNVVIPLDYDSLIMLTAYYYFEQILDFWKNLGLDLVEKYTFFYAPSFFVEKDISVVKKNNAAFVDNTTFFLLFETSIKEKIPFSINKFIIAHEFGHLIFNKLFLKNGVYLSRSGGINSQRILRSINEGCADFFAYVFTNRVDELRESDSYSFRQRLLPVSFRALNLEMGMVNCSNINYCWGSILASALYDVSLVDSIDRIVVAKNLFKSIEEFRLDWEENKDYSDFDFFYLLKRIIKNAADRHKNYYCQSFKYWFNDSVNYSEIESYCQYLQD